MGDIGLDDLEVTGMIREVMIKCHNWDETVRVTARLIKELVCTSRDKVCSSLTVRDIKVAQTLQFAVSMEPTISAYNKGQSSSLRLVLENGSFYTVSRCGKSLLSLLGIQRMPVLARNTRLAWLIVQESHDEDHRSTSSDVLVRSRARQRAWIIRGRFLARLVCKSCPKCRLKKARTANQIMANKREKLLPYVPKPLTEIKLGVQSVAVICPLEEL